MKTKAMILAAALGLALSACSGNKADEQNADTMQRHIDTTQVTDSTGTDNIADSTTNAPADVKH